MVTKQRDRSLMTVFLALLIFHLTELLSELLENNSGSCTERVANMNAYAHICQNERVPQKPSCGHIRPVVGFNFAPWTSSRDSKQQNRHRGHNNPQIQLTRQTQERRGAMKLNQCRHLGRSGWLRRVEGGGSGGGKGREVGREPNVEPMLPLLAATCKVSSFMGSGQTATVSSTIYLGF